MDSRKINFPWHYFWRVVRLNAILVSIVLALFWALDPQSALKSIPYFGLALVLNNVFFYLNTKPLRRVLHRVEEMISNEVPYHKQLKLFYQKDEWTHIEAALNEADQKQRFQLKTIQEENRKFTTLLGSISNEILAIDNSTNVLFYNPQFEQTFLVDKEKLQTGGKLWSVLEIQEAIELFKKVLLKGEVQRLRGFKVQLKEDIRYYNLTVSPLTSDDGVINGAVGVFSDITEIRLTEQMRADFVANVSHEIRTPLTSIKGFNQMLKSQKNRIPEELHDYLDRISHNTERMISLFTDLLNLSVIESRDLVEIEPVHIEEIIDHVEASMKAQHVNKRIQVNRFIKTELLYVDKKLFEQVLTNLFENACKYGSDTPLIEISTSQNTKNQTLITLKDDGPGIAKEHLNRIFERFYRVDHSRDRGTGGTGLGLAIVKHIIAKHQGDIAAESNGIKGTTFVIKLPNHLE
jgi:two-component system, OmpR family, phosphate regulon sensor histidine kinase PhoR